MIGFKGRLGFIQYMLKKPQKWGIMKVFVLSDAHNGYMYNWHLYTGMKNVCEFVCIRAYTCECNVGVHMFMCAYTYVCLGVSIRSGCACMHACSV